MGTKRNFMLNKIEKNDLFDYPNRYIFQYKDAFKFSLDSILLAEFVRLKNSNYILDMCTGNAVIPLILSTKTKDKIIAFEVEKEIYELGKKSILENKLENQINIINDDIKNITNLFPGKYFDIITCNPPFFKIDNIEKEKNINNLKTIARHEVKINLLEIFKIVHEVLKDNGTFYLVHRLNRLDEIILDANKFKLQVKEIQIICTKENNPKIGLFKIVKNGKIGLKINNIIDVSKLTTYQNLFKEVEK